MEMPAELLSCPFCGGMSRDSEMENASTVMCQHQKYIENLKPYRWHGKKVDRYEALEVVLEEGPPTLRRWFSSAHQVLADTRLTDLDAKFEQLAMNPRSSPQRVFAAHGANQLANFFRHARSPKFYASNLPSPEQAKAFAAPAGNSGRFPDEDPGTPILPDRTEPCPQESIRRRELRPLHRALQNTDLMTKRDDLELKRCTTLA
jgi:hypothetical protein